MAAILRTGNTGVTTLNLTIEIGNLIETEVNLRKIRMSKDSSTQWARRMIKDKPQESLQLYNRIKKVLKDLDGWTWDMKVQFFYSLNISLIYAYILNHLGQSWCRSH